jgi:hypothetical protein
MKDLQIRFKDAFNRAKKKNPALKMKDIAKKFGRDGKWLNAATAERLDGTKELRQIAEILEVNADWLLTGEGVLPAWASPMPRKVSDAGETYSAHFSHAKRCEDMLADLLQAMRRQTEAIEAMRADISKLAAGPAANPLTAAG